MNIRCDICHRFLPRQRTGRQAKRHQGACLAEYRRRYQQAYLGPATPRERAYAVGTVPGDLTAEQIDAIFAARLAEVRGTFRVEPWAQRGPGGWER